jgi:hypothetical protein
MSYPPNFTVGNNTAFNLVWNGTLVYNHTDYSSNGHMFNYTMNESGRYYGICTMVLDIVPNSYLESLFGRFYDSNVTITLTNGTNVTYYLGFNASLPYTLTYTVPFDYYELEGTVVNAGAGLDDFIGPNTMFFLALMIDMVVTGFFVTRFGVKSAFIFLLLWGLMLTIMGGWGIEMTAVGVAGIDEVMLPNMGTGLFIVGFLLWMAIMLFPYRRD